MLELINANAGLVAGLFISGAALGVIVARFTLPGPKRVRQLEEELAKAQREHETYRAGVTSHFKKTAELVGEMTQSYKAVYDHLAYGAQSLCGEYEALTSSVFGPPRVIHDPKVAVGETVVAAATAATAAAAQPAAEDAARDSASDDVGDDASQAQRADAGAGSSGDAAASTVPTFSMSEEAASTAVDEADPLTRTDADDPTQEDAEADRRREDTARA